MVEPSEIDFFYEEIYSKVSATGDLESFISKYYHRAIEKNVERFLGDLKNNRKVLEVGSGKGEHLRFVNEANYDFYTMSDIRVHKQFIPHKKTSFIQADVEALPFDEGEFSRVISTCLLHHLERPWIALSEMKRVVKKKSVINGQPQGLISIALPHDPGIGYRMAKKIATWNSRKSVENKSTLRLIDAREHRNHFLSLKEMIQSEFKTEDIVEKSFPFGFRNYHLDVLTVFQILI